MMGCIFVGLCSMLFVFVMLAMVPSVRNCTRFQLRRVLGRQVERVTIPEGWNRFQVAERLASKGVVASEEEFLSVCQDRAILSSHGIPASSAEGYLFPDTYEFYLPTEPGAVVEAMLSVFDERYGELTRDSPGGPAALADLGPDVRHVAVIIASIVEKEAARQGEKPLIAGVFLNRLLFAPFPSRLLQADPTVSYGCVAASPLPDSCEGFTGKLARTHLADATNPYNTYVHDGLPPGPIANPGETSLAAVLAPAETDYLYFMARGNGTHKFSVTLEEHKKAVVRYRDGE